MTQEKFYYDNKIVKLFAYATLFWGIVGMLVGLLAAAQIAFPSLNFGLSFTTFGRVRPVHTNAIVFAFTGNAIFTGAYYSMQRLLKARMFSDFLSKLNFWGWQIIILLAAVTLLAGISTSKEYAELEWPIDILIAIVWVSFGWNMIGTLIKRRVQHIYVAIWFFLASFVAVAVLHIGNSIAIPVSMFKSYTVYAGVQDAVVQWWYGHNAVAFFLTTPFLGIMYYFLPKAANRPVYSYRLSIVHFWSLIFMYMWAGPHHLLYQALPDWAQTLGIIFSIMLLAPSWGGMINGLLTLRGAWDRVRDSAILKFFVVGVTAYGMSTFEGPLLSLKTVNALSHFTDWTIAHVHIGGMGWNGFLTFGMLYWLIPRLFNTKLASEKSANMHFWIGTFGMLLYSVPLYWAAFTQTLMWKEFADTGFLAYPDFLDTVTQIMPMYITRTLGGVFYFAGAIMMIFNIVKTVKSGNIINNEEAHAAPREKISKKRVAGETPHRWVERKAVHFTVWVLIAIIIGGLVEIIPMIVVKSNIPTIEAVKPYTPLELEGRDIYVGEGCHTCHSQSIRPFRSETERYGEYSKQGEFVYDHPYQWGSKRTGPDLARSGYRGGKMFRPAIWHYEHFLAPQEFIKGSIMPPYPWLFDNVLDRSSLKRKIEVMIMLGVPYDGAEKDYDYVGDDGEVDFALVEAAYKTQAQEIEGQILPTLIRNLKAKIKTAEEKDELKKEEKEELNRLKSELATLEKNGIWDKEIIAMIAYMHKLGKDISLAKIAEKGESTTEVVEEGGNPGAKLFATHCMACHGDKGQGGIGSNLGDKFSVHGATNDEILKLISDGFGAMSPFAQILSETEMADVVAYTSSLIGTNPEGGKEAEGEEIK